MAETPNSLVTPQKVKTATVPFGATANTSIVTPVNAVLLLTAGANGARLTRLEVTPTAAQAATQAQFYRSKDTGTTKRFIRGIAVPVYTASNTALIPVYDVGFSDANPLYLEPGEQIYQASPVAITGLMGVADYADY